MEKQEQTPALAATKVRDSNAAKVIEGTSPEKWRQLPSMALAAEFFNSVEPAQAANLLQCWLTRERLMPILRGIFSDEVKSEFTACSEHQRLCF